MQIDIEQLQTPVNQWIQAFNTHNVEAIVALYADNAELFDSGMKHPRRGKNEIEQWFRSRFSTMPSIRYTPTSLVMSQEQQVSISWTTQGNGPRLLGLPFLSRPFHVDGISVFQLQDDGLILKQRGYYDHLAALEQLLPPLKWLSLPRL